MSVSLTVVESQPQASEAEVAIVKQGRLAKIWSKVRVIGTAIQSTPRLPYFEQLHGLGPGAWFVGFVGSILILNRFVSPLITTLAMSTLIIPVSALVLLILGEALSSVNPANVTTNELAAIANVMSNGLRLGLGVVICIHLWFVYLSYGLIHKTLNAFFDFVVKKTVEDGWY
jgi:hypothetical protein